MNNSGDEIAIRDGDAVEALLRKAERRQSPPENDEKQVRDAVRGEWQTVVKKRRSNRRWVQMAVAASVLATVAALFSLLQINSVAPVEVATIDKRHGTIYLIGERAEFVELADLARVHAGQVIATSDDAGIGLTWAGGGSLRVDRDSRVEFVSAEEIRLRSGRIYFDSHAGDGELLIDTDHGQVSHVGTQYMVATNSELLVVSVREGEVTIAGTHYDEVAFAGKQITLRGSARPGIVELATDSETWQWTEATAPAIDVDGMSAWEFLQWVGRQTGKQIVFASPQAEHIAQSSQLRGAVNADPRTELRLRLLTLDLQHRYDPNGGLIIVSETN